MTARPDLRLPSSGMTDFGPDVRRAGLVRADCALVDFGLVARLHVDLLRVASAVCPRHI
ncbi:putative leader peptide [Protofrankia symbiont of Coriaria ruscifolia]|uniref:putative leader peptide n=1 Tax=Protofrankia symbiont of Coriaria ruscifolia TaxID=1306542 RepID=UPI0013EFBAD5|nr:putative leader peptide [Protofrankia symbiont of Coriaria ruscifolia]